MSRLTISEIPDKLGEECWRVGLFDSQDIQILESTTPLTKGEAHTIAKALKFKGSDALIVDKKPSGGEKDFWIITTTEKPLRVELTTVTETSFVLLGNATDKEDPKTLLGVIATCLLKADITWQPQEANPAEIEISEDQTETLGIPGS